MWDVVVAGAGPAGTVAATILARAGARVLIVDRARFPRDKLCGDSINPGTLRVLRRLDLARTIEQHGLRIDGMRVCGPSAVQVAARYPESSPGCTVLRRDLDWWLLQEAIRAGAQFEDGVTVRRPRMLSSHAGDARVAGVIVTSRTRGEVPVSARVTIAADGRRSTLAFGLHLARHPTRPRRWAVGAYFEGGICTDRMGEMHIRPGEYVGVAPLPGQVTNVCAVGTPASLKHLNDPERALRSAIGRHDALRDRIAGARLATRPVVLGPLAVESRAAGMRGLLLAGDAAGFVDPMTGDGLQFAVRGGELAAETALEMLATGDLCAHTALARRRRAVFLAKRCFNRTLRRVVDSPAALRLATLAASVAPAYVQMIVATAGGCARPGPR